MAVFEIADSDVQIELVIRRACSSDVGGSSSSKNNTSARKESNMASAGKPDAKPAAHSAKKIASHKPSSGIARSIEHGSIIDQLMKRIEKTHTRQEIEVSVCSMSCILSVVCNTIVFTHHHIAHEKELLQSNRIASQ